MKHPINTDQREPAKRLSVHVTVCVNLIYNLPCVCTVCVMESHEAKNTMKLLALVFISLAGCLLWGESWRRIWTLIPGLALVEEDSQTSWQVGRQVR